MSALYLWDDSSAALFAPFALTRPVSELRAGALLIRERWEHAFRMPAAGSIASPELEQFDEMGAPTAAAVVPAGAIVANSRFVPSLVATLKTEEGREWAAWRAGGKIAALRLPHDLPAATLRNATSLEALLTAPAGQASRVEEREAAGHWLDGPWQLISLLEPLLGEDILALLPAVESSGRTDLATVGDHPVLVERGATIEPLVCLDATAGPILVRRGARVCSFTRLVGPSVVGEGSTLLGGRVECVSIGERCKVAGDMSHTVLLAYSNKAHDGFVGHSYLGRWVNLGAGTITSNLKNTYGPVSIWTPHGMRDTGMQFLGTLFGDHAKTGIGTNLSTGTVVGAGANVFGGGMPPRAVPPFAWGSGEPYSTYELARFLLVAERMMERRGMELSARARGQLSVAHAARGRVSGS